MDYHRVALLSWVLGKWEQVAKEIRWHIKSSSQIDTSFILIMGGAISLTGENQLLFNTQE
jgi:hypothetical protein